MELEERWRNHVDFFKKLKEKLTTSTQEVSQKFTDGFDENTRRFRECVNDLVYRFREVDEDFFDELEDLLIQADVGVTTTMDLVEDLKEEVRRRNLKDPMAVRDALVEVVAKRYKKKSQIVN